MNYIFHILVMVFIYGILTLSLNLLVGYAGLISICQAAFYGIGAYAATLIMINFGANFFLAMLLAVIITGVLSLLIAYPSLRLKDDYFVLATLAFQLIIFAILYNWVDLTRGPYGIPGIPRPALFGLTLRAPFYFFLFAGIIFSLICLLFKGLYRSPFGRALKAIREDELTASAIGKNITALKIWAFAIAAGIAAISGSMYSGYVTYIDPSSFSLNESIFIISIVVIGGSGNLKGPLVGTMFMVVLPEVLRFSGLPGTVAPNVRQIILGLAIIIMMKYRPKGIAGDYKYE